MEKFDLFQWMLAEGYAENSFEINGIFQGLQLGRVDDEEKRRRVAEYRKLRPIKSKREKGVKYYDSKTAFGLVLYGEDMFTDPAPIADGADESKAEQYKNGVAI